MKQIFLFLILAFYLCFATSCKSKADTKVSRSETIVSSNTIEQDIDSPEVVEFTKAKEGFLSESLFQVAVSSVSLDAKSRKEEALNIAEQKALNLLKTFAPPSLSDRGRKELREISKEGKLVDKNISVGNRYFFLYQIQKKDLKRLVTSGLE